MNDGIMNTWEVVSSIDSRIVWNCAKKETAEYLRDWENAICEDSLRKLDRTFPHMKWSQRRELFEDFRIQEGEVIL